MYYNYVIRTNTGKWTEKQTYTQSKLTVKTGIADLMETL